MLSDWCLGFVIKILLKTAIIKLSFLDSALCIFSNFIWQPISPKHRIRSIQLLSLSLMFKHVALPLNTIN